MAPDEILREKIVLSDLYDLTTPGKYYLSVRRKLINPNGEGFVVATLEKIEIVIRSKPKE